MLFIVLKEKRMTSWENNLSHIVSKFQHNERDINDSHVRSIMIKGQ